MQLVVRGKSYVKGKGKLKEKKMSKFLMELFIGIAAIIGGILLSIMSREYLFYGLIIYGLLQIVYSFIHLSKIRKNTDSVGFSLKKIYPKDNPQEKARFIETVDAQENLNMPKEVSISCSRKDQRGPVFLNGVEVGMLTPDSPVSFSVTKVNNVVNVSEQYEGICFFHVTDIEGTGLIKVGIGLESKAVRIVPNTGLENGIIDGNVRLFEKNN